LLLPLAVFVFVVATGQDVVEDGRNKAETACDVVITGNGEVRAANLTLKQNTKRKEPLLMYVLSSSMKVACASIMFYYQTLC
jgi:hypothetical protein